jgi:hypothetical protein
MSDKNHAEVKILTKKRFSVGLMKGAGGSRKCE